MSGEHLWLVSNFGGLPSPRGQQSSWVINLPSQIYRTFKEFYLLLDRRVFHILESLFQYKYAYRKIYFQQMPQSELSFSSWCPKSVINIDQDTIPLANTICSSAEVNKETQQKSCQFWFLYKKETSALAVWVRALSTRLWTERSLVQFPVSTHALVAGQAPGWGNMRGIWLMFLSISFSLPSPLSKIK